jgi:hypothetical protein
MKTLSTLAIAVCAFMFSCSDLLSAPIPQAGPFDITGTISEATWFPPDVKKGRPGFSGSLGHDRRFPAHFVVKLVDYSGVPARDAIRITRYVRYDAYGDRKPSGMPRFIILKLDSDNRSHLRKGMKIRVSGYTVRGDEGGTWTRNSGIKVY